LIGLYACCVIVVEDSLGHRRAVEKDKNALFFRYEDDSLRECIELVCARPADAYPLAEAGLSLRDEQSFRFGAFHNILDPRSQLDANSLLSRHVEDAL
jgi:hypothetical protein